MAYRRLIPRERSILTWAELWAEDDHLLSVRSHRLSSQYQRFPLSEIQAVSVTELPHWTISQIGWLASSTLLLGVSVLAPTLTALRVFFGIFTVWPFLFALQEVLRGPRCRTTIHTVTGAHVLAAVGRM